MKKNIQLFVLLFCLSNIVIAQPCITNDICETATALSGVVSDQSFICQDGCNLFASPDALVSPCQMGDFPTVWYSLEADSFATILNIEVHSQDFESPVISVFKSIAGCSELEQLHLTNGNLSCVIGAQGVAKAVGTTISPLETYYIAVSSLFSIGGDFEVCVSTISDGSHCVLSRDIEIVARSNGGSLEGPFDPGEKVSFCMNVNTYTPVQNGCQWFQGIVPVFGNGWDPTSLDADGQPLNAKVNGNNMGATQNGIYGGTTWDWFDDVGYHFDNSRLRIGDFDSNGTIDICNSVYEINCSSGPEVTGGCCFPCWDDAGDTLPPGWFAYGIEGHCADPGPPISADWGDGNSCGGVMGPWSFCFDMVTRSAPDCLGDSTKKDLTIGFYTFADGETGSWEGDSSVCAYDQPVKLSLKTQCGRITRLSTEQLPPLSSGATLRYKVEEPGINRWEWNISPYSAVPYPVNMGDNGFMIEAPVYNTGDTAIDVTGILIGYDDSRSEDLVIKKFTFKVDTSEFVSVHTPIHDQGLYIKVYPQPAHDKVYVQWDQTIGNVASISILNTAGNHVLTSNVKNGNSTMIDVSHLAPGVYFIRVDSSRFRYVAKMVK